MSKKTTKINYTKALALLALAAVVAFSTSRILSLKQLNTSGGLFSNEGGGIGSFAPRDSLTAKECSDCHQAYDAGLMPQGAWIQLMGDLSNHFGEDASLDPQTQDHITQYMVKNAASGTGPIRITEQRWFKGEHGGGKEMFKCDSCHR